MANQPAQVRVVLQDFPGLMSRPDPDDIPPGAATEMVNLACSTPGELRVRPGLKELLFED